MKLSILLSFACLSAFAAGEWSSDFAAANGFAVGGDARAEPSGLVCPAAGWATVDGSGEFHVGDDGLTMSAVVRVVRPQDCSSVQGVNLFSKGTDWFFTISRAGDGQQLLFRFKDDKGEFVPAVNGGRAVPDGQWVHCAAAISRVSRPEKGEMGYAVRLYLNGDKVADRECLHVAARRLSDLVKVGCGPDGAVWPFCGTIRKASLWRRTLSEDEIERDALSTGLVRMPSLAKRPLSGSFRAALAGIVGDDADWIRASLVRAAELGADQATLAEAIAKRDSSAWRECVFPRSKALVLFKGAGQAFPLVGFKDRAAGRDVFGRRTFGWELEVRDGEIARWFDGDAEWSRSVSPSPRGFVASWSRKGVTVTIDFTLLDGRIESRLRVDNSNPDVLLRSVAWPTASCAKLDGRDRILIPFMAGIEHFDPTEKVCEFAKQDAVYPSCNMNLPMGAYYNGERGIYYALEDPSASTKRVFAAGRRGSLDFGFQQNVAFKPNQKGGNSFVQPGVGVVEIFGGDWFDAAQIYKRFLAEKKPFWWVADLPREETPKWFRDLCVTFCHSPNAKSGYGLKRTRDDLVRMREYFELPTMIHTREYTRHEKTGFWPHYAPDPGRVAYFDEMKSRGVRVSGYVDDRLWCTTDSPDKEHDWEYGAKGREFRIVRENGETPIERYSGVGVFDGDLNRVKSVTVDCAVMCPAAAGWREWLVGQCLDVAGKAHVDEIYHDQIMACAQIFCFNPAHGHAFNDPRIWVEGGYAKYLKDMRRKVAAVNPGVVHSSEDGAEAYCAGMLDSCLNWRWNYESVPLYVSLYAGRFQFHGRVLGDGQIPGTERGGAFVKLAEELVRSEKIGAFYEAGIWGDVRDKELMLFAKRMAHLRHALLPYLNGSEFLRPPKFRSPMPRTAYVWNRYAGGRWKVRADQVQASAWERQRDGAKMAVFVNTETSPIAFEPILPGFGKSVAFVGDAAPVEVSDGKFRVSLGARSFAVVVSGGDSLLASERARLAPLFEKIVSFREMD